MFLAIGVRRTDNVILETALTRSGDQALPTDAVTYYAVNTIEGHPESGGSPSARV